MGWAAVLRFVSMIKSFQPAQPGSFQWVDSTKATKKPSIHVARLALPTVRLHRYYRLLLWPINGSFTPERSFMLRQHSLCKGPKLRIHHKSQSTFQDYLPVCPLSPAAVHVLDRERLEDLRTKGLHAAKDTHLTRFHMPPTCWLCCGARAWCFYRRVATFHSNILFTKSAYTVEPVPFVQMSPLPHRMGCSMKLAHTCLMFR